MVRLGVLASKKQLGHFTSIVYLKSGVGCTKARWCYPPDSDFSQLPQKSIKINDIKNTDLARYRK